MQIRGKLLTVYAYMRACLCMSMCSSLPKRAQCSVTQAKVFNDSWHRSVLLLPTSRWHSEVPPCAVLSGLDEAMSHGYWNGPWGQKEKVQRKKIKQSRHGDERDSVKNGKKATAKELKSRDGERSEGRRRDETE